MQPVKDLFSEDSAGYAQFRPSYPLHLYEFLYEHLDHFEQAWDAGTGPGQVACALSTRFQQVIGTDVSEAQIAHAEQRPNISYIVCRAEQTPFPDAHFDLITAAQAVHWFDSAAFYREARRTAKPGALIAVWGYDLLEIGPFADELITAYHRDVLGPYWDYERRYVDDRYKDFPFPFEEIPTPGFELHMEWTLTQLEGYLGTWSALRNYRRETGKDPLPALMKKIAEHWSLGEVHAVRFPVFLRAGRC
ncbi:MAG: class I SAM-dependent methyltransferase [Saprospiraceae bacterium]|nr:class I SAM-dependent methyltransferase [Saprospiraceae bacterium]